jgi:hypothetical protein
VTYQLGIFLAWALYGVIGPIILRGDEAWHTALAVWMPKELNDGNWIPAVKVQEVGEWRFHKLLGVISALPGFLFSNPLLELPAVVLPLLVVDALSRKIAAIDMAGHGAEIIAAEREGLVGYREAEIIRSGYTKAQIDRMAWLAKFIYLLGR